MKLVYVLVAFGILKIVTAGYWRKSYDYIIGKFLALNYVLIFTVETHKCTNYSMPLHISKIA